MSPAVIGVLIPIVFFISFFAMILGIYYLKNRERMAMIERGLEPVEKLPKKRGDSSVTLTSGLLFIGAGFGLLLAYLLDFFVFRNQGIIDSPAIYFSLIAIFGGLGLLISYLVEQKANKNKVL